MKAKTIASLVLSATAVCAQFIGLSYASSAVATAARGGQVPQY